MAIHQCLVIQPYTRASEFPSREERSKTEEIEKKRERASKWRKRKKEGDVGDRDISTVQNRRNARDARYKSVTSWDLLQLWNRFCQSHRIQRLYRIQETRERSLRKRSPLRSYWACLHRAQVSKQSHKIFVRDENSIAYRCYISLRMYIVYSVR